MRALPQVPLPFVLAPHSDADTSREAAKGMEPHLARLEAMVLGTIRYRSKNGAMVGFTAQELEDWTQLPGNTIRPRLVALRARGLVRDSGDRRKTRSGRNAVVWVAT